MTSVRYITSNYSANASAPLPSQSTIYNANISGPIPSQGTRNENLQDSIDNNNNNNNKYNYDNYAGNSSIYNIQQPALSPTLDTLVEYPDGQLGKALVVLGTSRTIIFLFLFLFLSPSSTSTNDTIDGNQESFTNEDEEDSVVPPSPTPSPFGLNETSAFVVDFGFSNSSASAAAAAAAPDLPKIIMLDVQTGDIAPFLALKQPDSNFMPIDVAFDYNNNALYVLSIGNNQEEGTNVTNNPPKTGISNNDNTGVIWKISYQGEEEEGYKQQQAVTVVPLVMAQTILIMQHPI